MKKTYLLAGAAFAFAVTPALAQEVDSDVSFSNDIAVSSETNSTFDRDTDVDVDIDADGDIDVDAAAIALSDSKQVITDNEVVFDEPTEADPDSTADNTADAGAIDVDGNAGVNVAAGYYNSQSNIGTIAVATGGGDEDDVGTDEDEGGAAMANTVTMQSLTDTYYGPENDDAENDPYSDTNTASVTSVDGDGNIGVNSAAGAFNMQQNIMTLAVATDSALADASAAVVQTASANTVVINDSTNDASVGTVDGSGNIGVNIAAGVGNLQHNSLTVAASGAFGGNGTGGTDGGGL